MSNRYPTKRRNGPTGLYFGVSCYRRPTIGASPPTFHTVSPRTPLNRMPRHRRRQEVITSSSLSKGIRIWDTPSGVRWVALREVQTDASGEHLAMGRTRKRSHGDRQAVKQEKPRRPKRRRRERSEK